jgi:Lon-like ATP-dependent protease
VIRKFLDVDPRDYDIHLNFPGGVPVDGPSAGIAMVTAIYSAVTGRRVDNEVAMTGEISIRGEVKPVGGVPAKIDAAASAGVSRVLIPEENWQEGFEKSKIRILRVRTIEEVMEQALLAGEDGHRTVAANQRPDLLSASSGSPRIQEYK